HRPEGHGQLGGEVGGDVDVGEAADAVAPEQAPRPARLPDDRVVHDGAGLDRLERVDLHALGQQRVLADEAVVAEHDALFGPGAVAQVAVATHDRPPQADLGAQVGVV